MPNSAQQFLRVCKLFVTDTTGNGLDLSELHIKFSVKRSQQMTPNVADIRIYNVELNTAVQIQKEFKKVVLQAGYPGNEGVIFQGNIKQVILGRESATDTFVDIIAGDGDLAYNFAVVNKTLAAGSTPKDQVDASIQAMGPKGVTSGHIGELSKTQLPRGKVMYGNSRNYLRNVAQSEGHSWSIQDSKVTFVKNTSYLPGDITVLTAKTGMIGTPEQTTWGVNVKCLLNPNIKIGGRIKIDNASVQKMKINFTVPLTAENTPAPLRADGTYYVLVAEHQGDNRGLEWYTSLTCLVMSVSSNPINAVQGAQ